MSILQHPFQTANLFLTGIAMMIQPNLALATESLNGLWLQKCSASFERKERFSGSYAELTETSFIDRTCSTPQLSIISSGLIFTGEELPTPEGTAKIDFIFEKVELVIQSAQTVEFFNSKKLCGYSNWQLNTAKEVTGLSCDFFDNQQPFTIPSAGEKRYGVYKLQKASNHDTANLQGDRLYFGKLTPTENAKSEAARPATLDPRYYVRISLDSEPAREAQAF